MGKIKVLQVIPRASSIRYRGTKKALPQIAHELVVEDILERIVLKSGDCVRITAQLIEAKIDRHIWAESYKRDLRDILKLRNGVARDVARQNHIVLSS